jgi:tape measure domain-containing protein
MIAGELEIRLRADIARLQRDMNGARQVVSDAVGGMERAATAAKAALASIGIGAGITEIARLSDEYTKFTAQLRLATDGTARFAQAYTDVKRVANDAQADLSKTGVLYARIATGVRELGVSQKGVANITEAVTLGLKVSGATAEESASAMLQLSQAFGSGALRGEEFNAVNEAAPRLMQALADGLGVPKGALKDMASQGLITSKVMAEVLPESLEKMRQEALQVQTIGGAFTVLKNNVMEFTGAQAQSNGTVRVITEGLGLLANNLNLVAGLAQTVVAVKVATWLTNAAASAIESATAARALAVANVTTARSQVEAAAAAEALAVARVAELRATAAASGGEVALGLALTGIIPAQARAVAAAETHAAALAGLAVAQGAASVSSRVISGALGLMGGPIGAIVTVLGLAATAWSVWGSKAEDSSKQAAESYQEAHQRIVKGLDEQIAKNEKLIKLQNLGLSKQDIDKHAGTLDQIGAASSRLNDINNKSGEFAIMGSYELMEKRRDVMRDIAELTEKMQRAKETGAQADAGGKAATDLIEVRERLTGVNKQYLEDLGKLQVAHEKGAVSEKEYVALVTKLATEEYKRSDAGKAAAEAADVRKAKMEANLSLAKYGLEVERNLRTEALAQMADLNKQGLVSDQDYYTARHDAAVRAGDDVARVKGGEIAILKAFHGKTAVEEADRLGKIKVLEAEKAEAIRSSGVNAALVDQQNLEEALNKKFGTADVQAINQQTAALKQQYESYGKLPEAVTAATIAKLEARKTEIDGQEGAAKEVALIDAKVAALRSLAEQQKSVTNQQQGTDLKQATELLAVMSQLDEAAKRAASAMENAFGRVGAAIGGMTTALSGAARAQAAIAAKLAADTKEAAGNEGKIAKAKQSAAEKTAETQISSYADMSAAAKGFFGENTAGYRALEGAEKAFRAVEMAMAIKNMVEKSGLVTAFTGLFVAGKATETAATVASVAPDVAASMAKGQAAAVAGVAGQAAGDPYSAFPRMALMAAAMAALGFAVSAHGNGADLAKQRQAAAGTGTVMGDASAKSESIAHSLDLIDKSTATTLSYTRGMLQSLRNIESSIAGLGNLVVKAGNIGTVAPGTSLGFDAGIQGPLLHAFFGGSNAMASVLSKIPVVGELLGGLMNKVGSLLSRGFGTSTSLADNGIYAGAQTVGSIGQSGLSAQAYADVEKTKKFLWIGYSKSVETQFSDLSGELKNQLSMVISNLATATTQAAGLLGVSGSEFTDKLNGFVVDLGKISLKGLTGDQIQKQFETIFSALGDKMAQQVLPQLDQFQKVGEGYYETLVRIANDYATVDAIMQQMGGTFGTVGTSSIAARERLIELAGGIDKLADGANFFAENFLSDSERMAPIIKDVSDKMKALGFAGVTTNDQFKDAVMGLVNSGALATDGGAKLYTALIALAPEFKQMTDYTQSLTGAVQNAADVAKQRADLEGQLYDMTHTSVEALARKRREELAAMDASLRGIQEQINAQEDLAAAKQALSDSADAALAVLNRSLDGQRTAARAGFDAQMAIINAQKAASQTAFSAHKAVLDASVKAAQDVRAKLASLSSMFKSTLDSMKGGAVSDLQNRQMAQRQISAALATAQATGALPDADAIKSALSVVSKPSESMFSSYEDYARDFYKTANDVQSLSNIADSQLDSADKQVTLLQQQVDSLQKQYDLEQAGYDAAAKREQDKLDADLKQFDAMQKMAEDQLSAAKGTLEAIKDLSLAMSQFGNAVAALKASNGAGGGAAGGTSGTTPGGGGSPVHVPTMADADAYREQYNKTISAYGDKYGGDAYYFTAGINDYSAKDHVVQRFQDTMLKSTTLPADQKAKYEAYTDDDWWRVTTGHTGDYWKTVTDMFNAGQHPTAHDSSIPGFASGGFHGGGLRIVGENGPELEATGPARYWTASMTNQMLSGGGRGSDDLIRELLAEMKAMRAEQRAGDAANVQATKRQTRLLQDVTDNGTAILTKAST